MGENLQLTDLAPAMPWFARAFDLQHLPGGALSLRTGQSTTASDPHEELLRIQSNKDILLFGEIFLRGPYCAIRSDALLSLTAAGGRIWTFPGWTGSRSPRLPP